MESHKAKPKSFQWSEPKWSYRPRTKAELSRILDLKMWLRIILFVAFLTAALAYVVNHAVPDLDFDWFGALAMSAGACVLYMAMIFAILWFISPKIRIWNKGIISQHGSSHRTLLRPSIRNITIDATDSTMPWLRVESAARPLECGIAATVSTVDLARWLRELYPEIIVMEKR